MIHFQLIWFCIQKLLQNKVPTERYLAVESKSLINAWEKEVFTFGVPNPSRFMSREKEFNPKEPE